MNMKTEWREFEYLKIYRKSKLIPLFYDMDCRTEKNSIQGYQDKAHVK